MELLQVIILALLQD
ncbi:undecaprenyl pyrophosphate phosphatase [Neptuniibacter caesariensis]|uniref:Undecaprenyl pyrophosphate phosphatase n=1 Tax=Neptuniibacter caesariensis TaxID=207954 RepID=A0A7U8C671_NEPCE|nr:undecaprenyl pyrophosphate phosphatase [Neptuniibacter caesariensis]